MDHLADLITILQSANNQFGKEVYQNYIRGPNLSVGHVKLLLGAVATMRGVHSALAKQGAFSLVKLFLLSCETKLRRAITVLARQSLVKL